MTVRMSLPESASVPELLRNLGFSTRRLAAYPTAAALHSGASTALHNLRVADVAELDAEESRLVSSAVIEVLTDELFGSVGQLSHQALGAVRRDREDARYRAAFSKNPSEVLKGSVSDDKLIYVKIACDALSADPTFNALAGDIGQTRTLLAQLEVQLATHKALEEAERVAEAALKNAAAAARDVFNALSPALTLLFPKKKVLVRSFFRTGR
ncbi:MAG: hypothetical protein RIT28_3438 [Pseudomonadota bacterium]